MPVNSSKARGHMEVWTLDYLLWEGLQFLGPLAYLWPGVSSRLPCQPTALRPLSKNGFWSELLLVTTAVDKGVIFMGKRLGDGVRTLPLKGPEYHLVSLRLSLKGNKSVLEKHHAGLQKKSP